MIVSPFRLLLAPRPQGGIARATVRGTRPLEGLSVVSLRRDMMVASLPTRGPVPRRLLTNRGRRRCRRSLLMLGGHGLLFSKSMDHGSKILDLLGECGQLLSLSSRDRWCESCRRISSEMMDLLLLHRLGVPPRVAGGDLSSMRHHHGRRRRKRGLAAKRCRALLSSPLLGTPI